MIYLFKATYKGHDKAGDVWLIDRFRAENWGTALRKALIHEGSEIECVLMRLEVE